jgi:hypothetical protein
VAAQLGHTDGNGRPDPTLIWRVYGRLFPGSGEAAASDSVREHPVKKGSSQKPEDGLEPTT